MGTWKDVPISKRPEAGKSTLLPLENKQTRLDARFKEIRETGQIIHDLVKVN
jgi:hypothetical protein